MTRNGRNRPRRPNIEVAHGAAGPEEAAAIAAAIEQFLRDTAPPPRAPERPRRGWLRQAMLEAIDRLPVRTSPWGDPMPWGR